MKHTRNVELKTMFMIEQLIQPSAINSLTHLSLVIIGIGVWVIREWALLSDILLWNL